MDLSTTTGEITQHTVIHNARISTTIIDTLKSRKQDKILISYILMLFIFWMFLVSQSKATGPNTHDQPINSYLQKSHQQTINSKVQCRRTYDSANTQTSWTRISAARMNLCREFNQKNVATSAGRVRRVSVEVSILCHDSLRCSKKDVTRRELSHWKVAFPKHRSQMLRLIQLYTWKNLPFSRLFLICQHFVGAQQQKSIRTAQPGRHGALAM